MNKSELHEWFVVNHHYLVSEYLDLQEEDFWDFVKEEYLSEKEKEQE